MFTTWLKEAEETGEATAASKARAFNNRGHAKYMQVDFDRAVEDYDRAVELDPTLAAARYNRATIKYRMGKFSEALVDFEAACQMEPNNSEFAEGTAECKRALEASA
jgi:tetratricopeptide (TPR) repeat protein